MAADAKRETAMAAVVLRGGLEPNWWKQQNVCVTLYTLCILYHFISFCGVSCYVGMVFMLSWGF